MGVGEQSWCEGGKDGEMEMFQGGRERERQMNRQIVTNAIIGCYSSNLIVPPKKEDEAGSSWARGRRDQAGRAGRQRSRGELSLPGCRGSAAGSSRQQMLGLQFLWQRVQANATSVQTWQP